MAVSVSVSRHKTETWDTILFVLQTYRAKVTTENKTLIARITRNLTD